MPIWDIKCHKAAKALKFLTDRLMLGARRIKVGSQISFVAKLHDEAMHMAVIMWISSVVPHLYIQHALMDTYGD
jgi:hypothetical protein